MRSNLRVIGVSQTLKVVVLLIKKCGEQRMWINSRKALLLNGYTGGFRNFYSNSVSRFRVTGTNNIFSYLSGNRCNLVRQFSTITNNMRIESLGNLKKEQSEINKRISVLIKDKV
jgi:hypothetical protein